MNPNDQRDSANRLNIVGSLIQDHASDQGWDAAQPHLQAAHRAHEAGRYAEARALIVEAHAAAFSRVSA